MLRKILPSVVVVAVGFLILLISILRSASRDLEFDLIPDADPVEVQEFLESNVDYVYTYPGPIMPGHVLWPVKALRDRVWVLITPDPSQKAELYMLFADKRLGGAVELFSAGKYEEGYYSLERSGMYMAQAHEQISTLKGQGVDVSGLLLKLLSISRGHVDTINELIVIAPENIRPNLVEIQNSPRNAFQFATQGLIDLNVAPQGVTAN